MRKLSLCLAVLAALLSPSPVAHADTISTFDLTGVTLWIDGSVTGQVVIDTTTGVVLGGNATIFVGGETFQPAFRYGFVDFFVNTHFYDISFVTTDPDFKQYSNFGFHLPQASLVGYTGGPLCNFWNNCSLPGGGGSIGSGAVVLDAAGVLFNRSVSAGSLTLESSVATVAAPAPEPSSLTLLATGVMGLASVARRRFGSGCQPGHES